MSTPHLIFLRLSGGVWAVNIPVVSVSGFLIPGSYQGDPSVVSLSSRAWRAVFRRLEGEKQWNWGMKTSGVRVLVGLAMIARTSGGPRLTGFWGSRCYGVPHVCCDFYRRLIYQ